jgi:hypothetical protein
VGLINLRPPDLPTFGALLLLWPTWLSYAVSYLFIAIVWTNHHYLIRYATEANLRLLNHHAERAVRAPSQPHAGGPEIRTLAGLARGGAGGGVRAQGTAEADPLGRDDLLARERAGRKRQE